jgi:DNA transformation protein
MAAPANFLAYLTDALGQLGAVECRRIYGGMGLFLDGLMFAIVAGGRLWLKTDGEARAAFIARGLPAFTYRRGEREVSLGYHQAPGETLESPEALLHWCRGAHAAALRSAGKVPVAQ